MHLTNNMTQFEAFRMWVAHWRDGSIPDNHVSTGSWRKLALSSARAIAIKAMREILDLAQNDPPDGQHDGSFTREAWTMARDLVASMAALDTVEAEIHNISARLLALR